MTSEPNADAGPEFCFLDPLNEDLPAGAWQQLCDAALDPNPFFSPAFLCPYLRHMEHRQVRLAVVREGKTGVWLLAAPVGRRRLGVALPTATVWATDYSPLGTPLMHPRAGPDAVDAFLKGAAGSGALLAIPYLPLATQTASRLRGATEARITVAAREKRSGHDAGPAGEQQLEAAFSGKRRKEMRRLLRRLGDEHATSFESVTGADVPAAFDAFLRLEVSGWKGRSGTALSSGPQSEAFARSAIANLAAGNGVRIDQLRAGDTLVAALVLIQDRGHVFSWKIAFDENRARFSPGAQIALHALRENLAMPGFKGADSLAVPGHSMIEPLWRGRVETATLLASQGAVGRLMTVLGEADLTAKRGLRRSVRAIKKRLART
ncbi:GNAT family N-acetyltransferase [Roseibium marinum]|uniref:CelD/BcsL family acetyltransferase involved in cellulose biosynthesis n=1 Tax=Roseibium marinum TaxID=281252 RepID=A0A2S3USH4_9HYPH|nr:GNAT family N-acetyltransferase [Roseibium marinum]POF30614.1 CelD/BcsL family acetyltransferase involved in cellulose biosynthesis [Roseibium marinum]